MNAVTIYKKDDRDIWWVQYRVNGTRVRKSLRTKDTTVAKRIARQIQKQLDLGELGACHTRIKLDQFWPQYVKEASQKKRRSTIRTDRFAWNTFMKWAVPQGLTYLHEVDTRRVEDFRSSFLAKAETTQLSIERRRNSMNVIHRHLSSMFSYAVGKGWTESNPWKKVKKLRVDERPIEYLSLEEIERVLCESERHSREMHLAFALGIYAGFRRSEIANARWEWFDLEEERTLIQPYGDFSPKGHRVVAIPMNRRLKQILEKYVKPDGYLFESSVPEERRRNTIRYDFKKSFNQVAKRAGLDWLTPHKLRHTFASQLAIAGVSLFKISRWLGHRSILTTARYAHLQVQDEDINRI
ncbi:MAG: tyrosine-type recombinase/integrase [bacterium]